MYGFTLPLPEYIGNIFHSGSQSKQLVSVASRSKTYVCGCTFPGIPVSNPAGGMEVCLLCVVTQRPLRQADSSSREEPYSVVRRCE